jgi:hypothetical protein
MTHEVLRVGRVIHGLEDNSRDRLLNIIWKSLPLINNIQIIIIQIAFKFKILIPEVTFLSSSRRAIIEDARAFLKTMVLSAFSTTIGCRG